MLKLLAAIACALTLGCKNDTKPESKAEPVAKPADNMPTGKPADTAKPAPPAKAVAPAAPAEPKTLELAVKGNSKTIKVKVKVPGELTAGDGIASIRDTNSGEFLTGIQFHTTCDGDCLHGLPDHLAKFVEGAPDRASKPNYNTGDAKLDAVRLDVQVVDKGDIPDGKFVAYRVKKPEGLEGPYRQELDVTCARMLPSKDLFVVAYAYTMLDTEKTFGSQMIEACKTFEIVP